MESLYLIMKKKWIQEAVEKPGTLHRQLGIPKDKKIPVSLLNKIISAKAGEVITNPTKLGKEKIKVTQLLERRAILARNLKKISKKNEK
jgi:hypothetical protein